MKEMNCNIANDLMPLYVDNVLSEDSKELLENHISDCVHCKEVLERMQSHILIEEDKDIKPFKRIRKKLLFRMIVIIFLLIVIATGYLACQLAEIPVSYVGDDLMKDMEVVHMEDGIYLRRENLSARGDIIIVDDSEGVLKFYIGENVPDHFRLAWWEQTCYTMLADDTTHKGENEITKVHYCDKDGNILYTLWEKGN
ncbi:MAG: zf-HC2 domain-containing protein [Lachnospiraceae bacterium]|nr:zf-HC2 domain-containing protein [Lachnospiraceae bacterium]